MEPLRSPGWSLYGALWLQPVAISRKSTERRNGRRQAKRMVRRGRRFESVRGLRVFACLAVRFVVLTGGGCGLRRPRSVHQRPPWTLASAELVEQADRALASVAGEVAVVAVDHGQAGAHVAREVEGGDAGTKREGGEGVAEIVDPAQRLDPGGDLRGLPLSVAGVLPGEGTASLGRGDKRGAGTPTP